MTPRRREFGGWPLPLGTGLVVMTVLLWLLARDGFDAETVRLGVRWTARWALILFLMAFVTSSALRLWPSSLTRWAMANRRYLGVSFGIVMGFHLLMLIVLGLFFPEPFLGQLDALTITGGGIAYAFTAAMVFTSSDRSVQRLGRQRWLRLHRAGIWANWVVFTFTYLGNTSTDPRYGWVLGSLLASAALRIAVARRQSP